MGNAVVHFEVSAPDDEPLVAFYGKVFGWELRAFPGGGYTLIDTRAGGGINGGIGRSRRRALVDVLRRDQRSAGFTRPGDCAGRPDRHARH